MTVVSTFKSLRKWVPTVFNGSNKLGDLFLILLQWWRAILHTSDGNAKFYSLSLQSIFGIFSKSHDIQYNDTLDNPTQPSGLNWDTQHNNTQYKCWNTSMLIVIILSVAFSFCMLNFIMLDVIMLNVTVLNALAPFRTVLSPKRTWLCSIYSYCNIKLIN